MSEQINVNETADLNEQLDKEHPKSETIESKPELEKIMVDMDTAFNMKMMEFDKKISDAELQVSTLKQQKMAFIYDTHVNSLVSKHKETIIKQQVEEEARKRLSEKKE